MELGVYRSARVGSEHVALKWLVGHPAITAVIPGTDRPQYMTDNLKAGMGRLPDAAMRKRMAAHIESL